MYSFVWPSEANKNHFILNSVITVTVIVAWSQQGVFSACLGLLYKENPACFRSAFFPVAANSDDFSKKIYTQTGNFLLVTHIVFSITRKLLIGSRQDLLLITGRRILQADTTHTTITVSQVSSFNLLSKNVALINRW